MCLTALSVAEMALVEAGADVEFGSGVAAAQAWFAQGRRVNALRLAAE
jgi:alanine-glyoxylate transaminase/serine-glyoxylate transaminase/serine-pyruvate transaminase